MRWSIAITLGLALFPVVASASGAQQAMLYEIGTHKPLFRMTLTNEPTQGSNARAVRAVYANLQGKVVMEEEARYAPDGQLSEYRLRQAQTGEDVRALFIDGKVNFLMKKGEDESAASEDLTLQTIINDQLEGLVSKNWEALQKGESVYMLFVVPLRKETIGFELVRDKEIDWAPISAGSSGKARRKKAMVLAMKPRNLFIKLFLRPISLTFDASSSAGGKSTPALHRLLAVEGRSSLKPDGDPTASDLDTLLEFDR